MSVAGIRTIFATARTEDLSRLISRYRVDERTGVAAAVATARRRVGAHRAEAARLESLGTQQRRLHAEGYAVVAGLDEVGRGALAGPVTAAAVVIAVDVLPQGVDDSKRLTCDRRVLLDLRIREVATHVAVAHVWPPDIDRLGIARAVHEAMRIAVSELGLPSDHALVDGRDRPELGVPVTPVVKGDSIVGCIAAASIVAKVARDALMVGLDDDYPGYGLAINKGYGTPEHLAALAARGPSPVHRRSFAPCTAASLF